MNASVEYLKSEQNTQPLLSVEQIGFSYASQPSQQAALKAISFKIQAGQFHALLGPNGAGKSTLFALISRLLKIQQGDVLLGGTSMRTAPAKALQQIGMVFQQSTLDLDLSVEDNLYYHACLHGLGGQQVRERINIELQRIEIDQQRKTKVRRLNGGHRRRVEIARALLHQPRLLLLDEATVGLDSRSRHQINRHIRKLCREQRVGVLWATHLIEEIEPQDPVTLLHLGQVLANTSAEQICLQSGQPTLVKAFESLTRSDDPLISQLSNPESLTV